MEKCEKCGKRAFTTALEDDDGILLICIKCGFKKVVPIPKKNRAQTSVARKECK